MSVPIHNLYDFIHQVTENRFGVLYFFPFGQKHPDNILNLELADSKINRIDCKNLISNRVYPKSLIHHLDGTYLNWLQPILLCHDQEPLFFEYYQNQGLYKKLDYDAYFPVENFNLRWVYPHNMQKKWIILHSEKQSSELEKYENSGHFVGAYYWSHALLSLDWYRFACYDNNLCYKTNTKRFLIYCRDTTGSRKYRQDFLNQIDADLQSASQIGSFFKDKPDSTLSAEYEAYDISNTDFSVVLETVFDNRIHLTEKTCRALATGHPFLLAAGPNSLQLLKDYGFKTFAPWIDESYDTIIDDKERLKSIVKSMKKLMSLESVEYQKVILECRKIAAYNKEYFFSDKFYKVLIDELKSNVESAYNKFKKDMFDVNRFYKNLEWRQEKNFCPNLSEDWRKKRNIVDAHFFQHLKKGGTLENYVPPDLD